jgi:hypothetical protein
MRFETEKMSLSVPKTKTVPVPAVMRKHGLHLGFLIKAYNMAFNVLAYSECYGSDYSRNMVGAFPG